MLDDNIFAEGVESPVNYEQKCCCVLVLDVSLSMSGKPIAELNRGLQEFHDQILNDDTLANRLEVALVAFSDNTEVVFKPQLFDQVTMPELRAHGSTKIVDGIREGMSIVRERKAYYKSTGQSYYRPWIIVMTDGSPDRDQDIDGISREIFSAVSNKDFAFFAIGVGDAQMDVLQKMTQGSLPPAKLAGLKFSDFFQWLSASLAKLPGSRDGKVKLDAPTAWQDSIEID